MKLSLSKIAKLVEGRLAGDGNLAIHGVGSLAGARDGQLSFVKDARYFKAAAATKASALIVPALLPKVKKPQIICPNPMLAFIKVAELVAAERQAPGPGIHPTAVIGRGVKLGTRVSIGAHVFIGQQTSVGDRTAIYPNAFIGAHCTLGADTLICPNAVIRESVMIGNRVIIHSGAVIGDDGFGYVQSRGRHIKIPQIGTVEIEDDVEVGANSTVARAALDKTLIKRGVKIDCHSHIAHNVVIGEDSMLIAYAKVAGGAVIGRNVLLAEDVGINDNITVGDGCKIAGGSNVYKSLPPNSVVWGSPARPLAQEKRIQALVQTLPALRETLRRITKRLGIPFAKRPQ
jgi:UDP-3-O-[3-hydroxymyristoyl] glucosamine N-acyltransferase